MNDYERLAPLELSVESLDLERRELDLGRFVRVTTTVVLAGDGARGEGEDVTYQPEEHDGFPRPDLAGNWTLEELSGRLEPLELPDYRRWAFESAALDLALRQAGVSLAEAVGRELPRPALRRLDARGHPALSRGSPRARVQDRPRK